MRTWLLVTALGGCNGGEDTNTPTDTDTDPLCDATVPTIDLPDFNADIEMIRATIVPSALDPQSDNFPQSHHELWLADDPSIQRRDELFLFLPGTNNKPNAFDDVAEIAARAGYPVLVLAWDSEYHAGEYCRFDGDVQALIDCRTDVFHEKAYGTDESEHIDIGEPDSIVGRARRVIERVHQDYPTVGADQWLDDDGLRWENIVVAGFSQGALMTGYLSKDHAVSRAVLLAGGCDTIMEEDGTVHMASWCTEARATPVERTWALWHLRDEPEQDGAILETFGLPTLGDYADAATQSPDYCTGTHGLTTDLPSADGNGYSFHLSVAHDGYLPVDGQGTPTLAEDFYYLFTAP